MVMDTIWHRAAQYRLTWRRHTEAFVHPTTGHLGIRLANDGDGEYGGVDGDHDDHNVISSPLPTVLVASGTCFAHVTSIS